MSRTMLRVAGALVLVTALALPNHSATAQNSAVKPVDDSEAYAVYASLLPREWIVAVEHATSLVVQKDTVTNWGCMPSGAQFEAEWRPVIDSLKVQNASVRTLRPDYPLGLPFTLLGSADIQAIIRSPAHNWPDFNRKYPESHGYVQVSAVGFDQMRTRAMVYIAHICGPECAGGMHHVLEKVDGSWREARVPGMIQCESGS